MCENATIALKFISTDNFSCMFLNPNNFFKFIRSKKPPGTS